MIPVTQMPWEWLTNVVKPDFTRPGPKLTYTVTVNEGRPFRMRAGNAVRIVEDLRSKLPTGAKLSIVLPNRMEGREA